MNPLEIAAHAAVDSTGLEAARSAIYGKKLRSWDPTNRETWIGRVEGVEAHPRDDAECSMGE